MRIVLTFTLAWMCCTAFGQTALTAEQWQADLRFLQQTVHKDYPFLFKKVTAATFDAEVDKFYQRIPMLAEHEVKVGLARIVSLFEYGHTALGLNGWYDGGILKTRQMPYQLMAFKDGLYLQGVHKDYASALGARVVKIAGKPVAEVLAAVRPAFPTENDQFYKAYGMHLLGNPAVLHAQDVTSDLSDQLILTLEKDGKTFEQRFTGMESKHFPGHYGFIEQKGDWLDARDQSSTPLWLDQLEKIYYFKYLPEQKAVYVRHSQIQDDPSEDIPAFYQRVFDFIDKNEVEKLILDVRLNGGGNNYKNKPIVTGVIRSEKINQPGNFFVIIGGRTFSACQNLVNELHNYTNAIFVGEPTGENINFYGDNQPVELPNSHLSVRLSFAWWQDKPQWEDGPWLPPQIAIEPTFADYQGNRDPVLDAIWGFQGGSEIILDPMSYLEGLFTKGEMGKVANEARRLAQDPYYAYYDFESQFNRAGYNLLGDGQVEAALFVFQLNVDIFPNSANAWDSLAEGHLKAGHADKAREYYNKAISMDPDGPTGTNARNMLKSMEK